MFAGFIVRDQQNIRVDKFCNSDIDTSGKSPAHIQHRKNYQPYKRTDGKLPR